MSRPAFSVVIPTIGRPSLPCTLASCQHPDVEIIVVADTFEMSKHDINAIRLTAKDYGADFLTFDAGHHDTGSPQLQHGYEQASGLWIMNLGDDDRYEPFAFETMQWVISTLAEPVPLMFRTILHPGPQRGNRVPVVLWADAEIRDKNITGQCFVIPNDPARMGSWLHHVDYGFITSTVERWGGRIEWRTEVISQCY